MGVWQVELQPGLQAVRTASGSAAPATSASLERRGTEQEPVTPQQAAPRRRVSTPGQELLSCVAPDTDAGASGTVAFLRVHADKAEIVLAESLELGPVSSATKIAELITVELPQDIAW